MNKIGSKLEKSAFGSFSVNFWYLLSSNELFRSSFCIFVVDMSCNIPKFIVCMHCERNKVESGKNWFWLIFGYFWHWELERIIWELIFNFRIKYTLWCIKIDSLYALCEQNGVKSEKTSWLVFGLYWAQMSYIRAHFKFWYKIHLVTYQNW